MKTVRLPRADALERRAIDRRSLELVREDPADAFVRSRGPLRRVLAALAERFVAMRGWEPLGFARVGDWARERVGLSARQVQDLARTGAALERLPLAGAALVSGALTWSQVRLVCRVAVPEDETAWVSRARALPVRKLEHEVRAVDRGSLEALTDEDGAPAEERAGIRIRCTPAVRARWWYARQLARRTAGEALPIWEAMEAIAAEVLSAFPLEVDPGLVGAIASIPACAAANVCAAHAPPHEASALPPARLPSFLAPLVDGLDAAGAFELDARIRTVVAMEQRLEAEIGRYLLAGGDAEHLGISPRKARGILRLARAAHEFPALAAAWREGRISWAKAQALLAALRAEPERAAEWLARAERETLRTLEDDVDRQVCAQPTGEESNEEVCEIFWVGPADVIRLFRATLCSVRRHIERSAGRLPTEGEALATMLDHVIEAWGGDPARRVPKAHRVFARDGWRCTAPGCTSYRNLHDHHIRFRSHGGSDAESNRTTLCAWHHLRGVHGGRLRLSGRAPDRLQFELRPATAPA
jgi:5-methylcytosine-specific restriction endonuclease McrA